MIRIHIYSVSHLGLPTFQVTNRHLGLVAIVFNSTGYKHMYRYICLCTPMYVCNIIFEVIMCIPFYILLFSVNIIPYAFSHDNKYF